jgi:phosphoglycerate dehydrogenase-like enzyme
MRAVVLASFDKKAKALLEDSISVDYAGWAISDPVVTPLPEDEEIISLASNAEAIIVPGELSREVIEACQRLRVIGVHRGDPRGVDIEAANERSIPVVYAAGRNAESVADLTLAFVLILLRQMFNAHRFVGEKRWSTWDDLFATPLINGLELARKTIGLIGFGYIGQEVVRRAKAFDMRVLVYDPYLDDDHVKHHGAKKVELRELMSESDIVSIHCKLSEETRGMIGERELGWMKPGGFLINTARAAVVDEQAFIDALTSGQLAGAALDVYWEEPLASDSRLLELPNLIHTPHIGGATIEVEPRTSEMVARDVLAVLRGETPERIANPEVLGSVSGVG